MLQRLTRPAVFEDGIPGIALLAGPANVIMQLGLPGVGYGVKESRVESGRIDRHPIKRARTTFTYLAVATRGTPEQQKAYRKAVTRAHAQVVSTEDSPVGYNALDPELQLWVAACLYKGGVDVRRTFIGEMDDDTADQHYRDSMALGTMLQMRPEMWPADRPAFDKYWDEQLKKIHIDDTIREFLYPIAVARMAGLRMPGPLQQINESLALLITTGFLPQRFRDEMKLDWNRSKQREFDAVMAAIRLSNTVAPSFVRNFPFNLLLHDVNWRMRTGRPLV
ncbi:oxygenase MpaB family protein [Mycolicibacterium sp.]|uniref:oxygenase MpaB family protein n=1 Tax=Mycolicibacterium sp. TaxID=2320850 RepID=UPI0025D5BF0C|nr:oxygenase MpaB family protein [Mycolicibacterium sp.]